MKLALRRSTRFPDRRLARRLRAGVSVVEAVVSLAVFGGTCVGLAGLSLAVARRAEANDLTIKRTAVLQQQMNWLQALPYDSLPVKAGSSTVLAGGFQYSRKVTVTVTGARTTVTVQVTPKKWPDKFETITFDRARPAVSPLCNKGC